MAEEFHDELQRRVKELEKLRGEPLLRALLDIVESAEAHGDGDTAAAFARHLIEAGSHEGRFDYEMAGFGHLKRLYERDARYADLRAYILWYYKWVTERLPEFAEISAERIESTFADMERFYKAEGEGDRPILVLRARAAAFMGDAEAAERYMAKWEAAAKVESDDCAACQTHSRVQLLLDMGKPIEAIEAAGPVLAGDESCEEVPATTFSRLLLPFLLLGKPDEAIFLHSVTRRPVRLVPKLVGYMADHVVFLSVIGAMETARRMAFVMTARAESALNTYDQFQAFRAAWVFLARFAKEKNADQIKLPEQTALGAAGEAVSVSDAAAAYEARAREVAKRLDTRNGTSRFENMMDEARQLVALE